MSGLPDVLGVDDTASFTTPCCATATTVAALLDQTVVQRCPHGCCVLTLCGFCGVLDGGWGPAACRCGCWDG